MNIFLSIFNIVNSNLVKHFLKRPIVRILAGQFNSHMSNITD